MSTKEEEPWGVWRIEAEPDADDRPPDPEGQWFLHSDGSAIVYRGEEEARSVMRGLQALLPHNTYTAHPLTPCVGGWHLSPETDAKCPLCKGSYMLPPTTLRTTVPDT